MGYQVAISMLAQDEEAFLGYLRQAADVKILRAFAPTEEELFIDDFSAAPLQESQFFLYNPAFRWDFRLRRVDDDALVVERRGFVYYESLGTAPLIEYDRRLYGAATSPGRLYWAERFAAPDGLAYDAVAFKRWYLHAQAWMTRHGRRLEKDPEQRLYLPAAYAAAGAAGAAGAA